MNKDVTAGSSITTLGHLALGITPLFFGPGHTEVIDGVPAADTVGLATYAGGFALFVVGLFAFRDRDIVTGTAFAESGALRRRAGYAATAFLAHWPTALP